MRNAINLLIKKAMLEKDEITKNILRLAKSEMDRESEKAKDANKDFLLSDQDNVIKKMIKNNQLTLKLLLEENAQNKIEKTDELVREINILKSLLPKSASVDDLQLFVSNNQIDISKCKSEGQAIGTIIKEAKLRNFNIDVDMIKEYIKETKLFQ